MASYESWQKNRFFRLGGFIGDMMILSGMWLLCSLPVVTLGASTAALYYGTEKCLRRREERPAALFLHSFRDNLRQGTLLTLIYLVYGAVVAADIYFSCSGIGGYTLPAVYERVAYVLLLPVAFTIAYVFPYISRFENTAKNALKNSFLLSAMRIDHTLAVLLLAGAAAVLAVLFPPLVLVTPALAAYLSSMMIEQDFSRAQAGQDKAEAPAAESGEEEDCPEYDGENDENTETEA